MIANEAMRVFTHTNANYAARALMLARARVCVDCVINTSAHITDKCGAGVIEQAVANVIADNRTVSIARGFACAGAHPTAGRAASGIAGVFARDSASGVARKSRASRARLSAQHLVLTRSLACHVFLAVECVFIRSGRSSVIQGEGLLFEIANHCVQRLHSVRGLHDETIVVNALQTAFVRAKNSFRGFVVDAPAQSFRHPKGEGYLTEGARLFSPHLSWINSVSA